MCANCRTTECQSGQRRSDKFFKAQGVGAVERLERQSVRAKESQSCKAPKLRSVGAVSAQARRVQAKSGLGEASELQSAGAVSVRATDSQAVTRQGGKRLSGKALEW